jgi:quercetin dioxygenase-like cupin family protein
MFSVVHGFLVLALNTANRSAAAPWVGQTLIITAGCGWTQCEGEPIVEIRPGDVVWCPPNHKHLHGATPITSMTHIAIQEALDGKAVEWTAHVTDKEFIAGPRRD